MTLIEMNGLIKTVLGREQADVNGCIELLERFQLLNLTPLMLLKNPSCVETVKRCRRYVGNVQCWGFSAEEIEEFKKKAQRVRTLAEEIYHQIKVGRDRGADVNWDVNVNRVLLETVPDARGYALLDGIQRVGGEADREHAQSERDRVCEPVRAARVAQGLVADGPGPKGGRVSECREEERERDGEWLLVHRNWWTFSGGCTRGTRIHMNITMTIPNSVLCLMTTYDKSQGWITSAQWNFLDFKQRVLYLFSIVPFIC